jgi:hypothetical protein
MTILLTGTEGTRLLVGRVLAYMVAVHLPETKRNNELSSNNLTTADGPTTIRHTGHVTPHYMIYHPLNL